MVYGQSRVSDISDDFEESEDTLRRELNGLADGGYVVVDTEDVGGAANPAHLYSLTDLGSKVAHEATTSDDNESVLRKLDGIDQRVAQIEAYIEYLLEQTDAQEHYLRQLIEIEEQQGSRIEYWEPDEQC